MIEVFLPMRRCPQSNFISRPVNRNKNEEEKIYVRHYCLKRKVQLASARLGMPPIGKLHYLYGHGFCQLLSHWLLWNRCFCAGLIASGTRIFDAAIDPFLALITDRLSTRFGRVRIMIVVGRAIQILCIMGLFSGASAREPFCTPSFIVCTMWAPASVPLPPTRAILLSPPAQGSAPSFSVG